MSNGKVMRKTILLCSLLCLLCTVNLFGGNSVSVKSGDASVFKKASKALLEIDYSSAKVGGKTLDDYLKERGDDFVRDWPRDKETAASYFKTRFNKKSKGMQLTTDASSASYKIVIHVNNLDMGNPASAIVANAVFGYGIGAKAGGVIMTGTIDIIDMKTNEVVSVLYIDEVKGDGHPSETIRLGQMYVELATDICKLK